MMSKTRRSLAVAIVLPAVLAVGACSKADEPNNPATNVATNTPAATSGAGTGQATGAVPTSAAPSTNAAPASGDVKAFVADIKAAGQDIKTAQVSMDMTGAGEGQDMAMTGQMSYDPNNPAMHIEMDVATLKMEMLFVDKKLYVKNFPTDPAGKWAVVSDSSSTAKELVDSSDSMDPAKMFDAFEQAATGVKELGPKTIDGEEMTEYELTIDPTKAKDLGATPGMPKEIVYKLAIDKDKHMRRVTFTLGPVTANVKMDKYNEPVDIKAPTGDVPTSKMP